MPRNVRNFWIEADVDGRKSHISAGPVRADGGIKIRILVRENGAISDRYMEIYGRARSDGSLGLTAMIVDDGGTVAGKEIEIVSKR